MTTVLLATSRDWPEGEPGHEALDAALAARGIDARWAVWDDASVDWAGAGLVAVRSTWDYVARHEEFLAWVHAVEPTTTVLNGADVFAWNLDKGYLARLGDVPVVPTRLVTSADDVEAAVADFGDVVVKPRVGAGGIGVTVVRRGDAISLPAVPVVAQPLVETVHTDGETSVFVIDGRAVSMVNKVPADGEIRVHEQFGGRTTEIALSRPESVLAVDALLAAADFAGRPLDYGRVDLLRYDGGWRVSELEVTEPGLYLDVLPANADPFADLVASRLR
ncbi:ATP-grasp domain-containing protein [Nocardioides sp. LHG3406-4]|uniref:ATP-grasp domain-containing protein n=1 Tax=Nocardioides sp. LHG3406-4 TaxID=2804575 RepID=UPI003CF3A328